MSPICKVGVLDFTELETSSLNDALCQVLLTWPSGFGGVDLDKNVNKRPMGHIAHLRKQFDSLYHNVDLEKKKNIMLMRIFLALHLKKLEFLSSRHACAKID